MLKNCSVINVVKESWMKKKKKGKHGKFGVYMKGNVGEN